MTAKILLLSAATVLSACAADDKALAEKIAADTSPDPWQRGRGTPAEFISNRFYSLRNARWTVRSGQPHGISYGDAVKILADFARQTSKGHNWQSHLPRITVPELPGKPVIDGNIRTDEWAEARCFSGEYPVNSETADKNGSGSRWYIGHDGKALYLGASFQDSHIQPFNDRDLKSPRPMYLGDTFEFFIRPDAGEVYYHELQINPAGASWELFHKASPFGQWDMLSDSAERLGCVYRVSKTADGYQLEARIPLDGLQNFKADHFSFLMVRVNRHPDGSTVSACPFPLLYDPHNIYGYCSAELE